MGVNGDIISFQLVLSPAGSSARNEHTSSLCEINKVYIVLAIKLLITVKV
jgi:hypothetical protein